MHYLFVLVQLLDHAFQCFVLRRVTKNTGKCLFFRSTAQLSLLAITPADMQTAP